MPESKSDWRKKFLSIRERAHASATPAQHEAMEKNLFSLPAFSAARTVLLYASKGSEAPTHSLIRHLLSEGKRVALPLTHLSERRLELFFISSLDDLAPSSFGVPEPQPTRHSPCSPADVDFALVPAIAFSPDGHRLGYGLGFYDRFLPLLSCPLAGLAYEAQLAPSLPHEKHDVPLHFIVTEKRTIDCRSRS